MELKTKMSKKSKVSFLWKLIVAATLLNLLAVAMVAWTLQQSRINYQVRAETSSQSIVRMMEQNIADMFERVESNLFFVVEEIEQRNISGGIDGKSLNAFLKRIHTRSQGMGSMRVVNAAGTITHGTGKTLVPEANVADREYFQYLRDHPDVRTYVSKPMIGRMSGEWILIFSRSIKNPDGTFGGVVNGTVELSHLAWLFSAIDVGRNGAVSLRNNELGVIVRHPEQEGVERGLSLKTKLPELQEFLQANRHSGSFTAKSSVDGLERIISVRKIGNYPLYLVVGLAPEDYLEIWWQEVVNSVIALAFFMLVIILASWLLYKNWVDRLALIEELDRNQKLFYSMAEMSADWFWVQDENFRFTAAADNISKEYGLGLGIFNGKACWEIGIGKTEEEWIAHKACLEAHQPFHDFEYCYINDAGAKRYVSISGEPVFDEDGRFVGYRGIAKDLTERKQIDDRIQHMAQFDALTNLPNRTLLHDRLDLTINLAKREQREFALLYLDLDRFKPVNDKHGHDAGDQLLRMAADRIRYLLRESDTVARIGGDEFVVLQPTVIRREDAEEVAQKIIVALTSPFMLDGIGEKICIGVSIGIALFPQDGLVGDDLLKSADAAMYKSKQAGNCYYFSDGQTNCEITPASRPVGRAE